MVLGCWVEPRFLFLFPFVLSSFSRLFFSYECISFPAWDQAFFLPSHSFFASYLSFLGWGGVWVQLLEGQMAHAHVIFVLCECIWNARMVSLVLPAFDSTSSLGPPPHQFVFPLVKWFHPG